MTALAPQPPLPLLMPYVRCPDCRHFGSDHPKRGEDAECIGGWRGFVALAENGTMANLSTRCECTRFQVGRR
jgi:hypothetical protein